MAEDQPCWSALAEYIQSHTGLTFSPARWGDFQDGIRRAMRQAGVEDQQTYLDLLCSSNHAIDGLIPEITVGETYFFRHPAHFEFLRREVLPHLRKCGRGIRLWSAGCSTGEEAYSLAILTEQEGLAPQARILATDISHRALNQARRAVYGRWSLRETPDELIASWFRHEEKRFRLEERLRRRVEFKHLNLVRDHYPSEQAGIGNMDVILCRNVLMYFDRTTIAHVTRRLFDSLAEGGWLLTGPADLPLDELAGFDVVTTVEGVFYRRPTTTDRSAATVESATAPLEIAEPPVLGSPKEPAIEANSTGADADAAASQLRDLANSGAGAVAEAAAAHAAKLYPLSVEVHFLRALILAGLGNCEVAAAAARRSIYLDSSLAVAHFLLGTILQVSEDWDGARRAYRNARNLAASQPPDQPLRLADGQNAGSLVVAAESRIQYLETARRRP